MAGRSEREKDPEGLLSYRHSRLRLVVLAIAALTAVALSVASYASHVLSPLELKSIDARFSIRGVQKAPTNIVIVGIDDQTIGYLRFPFPRRYHAQVINRLRADGAAVIGYDVQFTTPTDEADDNALIEAVGATRHVVLATTNGAVPFGGAGGAVAGSAAVFSDSDGVYRSLRYHDTYRTTTFAVAVAALALHRPIAASDLPTASPLIDFGGPSDTVKEVPFFELLPNESGIPRHALPPASDFRGKIVLIGATAAVLQDIHATSTDSTMTGVELQANAIETVLHGFPLRTESGFINLLLVTGFALLASFVALRLRPGLLMLALALVVGFGYAAFAQLEFNSGTVVSGVYPLLALVLGAGETTAADLWAERRHRRVLESELARLPGMSTSDFFVSYRRDEATWPARILSDELARRFGSERVFMDYDSIDAGQTWTARIEAAIKGASVVLVLMGPRWTDASAPDGTRRLDDPGDWVRLEVEAALANEDTAVVPVLLDGAVMPAPERLPASLAGLTQRNAVTLTAARWNTDIDVILGSIQSGRVRDFLSRERAERAVAAVDR
jgi:CHASE2 domain-containing sensor protein